MLVLVTSDKGGTGRSVTSANIAYRRALRGDDVCYVDFDFGSPTAGDVFEVPEARGGVPDAGVHCLLQGRVPEVRMIDVWAMSDREALRRHLGRSGRLNLVPGTRGGGEFPLSAGTVQASVDLLLTLEEEFDVLIVDCSAGRSYALEMALEATALPEMSKIRTRWLVFHRWTRQHITAASGLVFGDRGLIDTGVRRGHDAARLRESVRFVRTAVVNPDNLTGGRPEQAAWARHCDAELRQLAGRLRTGASVVLGSTPLEPLLQWREQVVTDTDVQGTRVANPETAEAFEQLAARLSDERAWEGL